LDCSIDTFYDSQIFSHDFIFNILAVLPFFPFFFPLSQHALARYSGIGRSTAATICAKTGFAPNTMLKDVEFMTERISKHMESFIPNRNEVFRITGDNINQKIKLHTYEGMRHQYAVSVRGQRRANGATQRRLGPARARLYSFVMAKPSKKKK